MKGMRKIKRGKGFRGAVSYAINREPGDEPGQIIGGNMSSKTVKKLSSEFGASRKLRPDIEKPVWHNALRLPEGEKVTPAKLVEIADDYMQRMGFTDLHQRLYVLHDDPEGQHVHIVASRVALDGSVYLGRNENLESTRHIQALEKSHNLEITKGPTLKDGKIVMPGKKKETQRETDWALANGKRPDRLELQDLIDDALQTPCTAPEFAERLALAGVIVLPNIASTGTMNGFSFKLSESILKPLAGSKIGGDYKWSKLQERGVDYDKSRDAAQLTQLKEQFARDAEQLAADQPGVTELTPIDSSRDSAGIGAVEPDRSGVAALAPGGSRGDSDGLGAIEADQPGVIQLTSDQNGYTEGVDGIRHDDSGHEIDARSPNSTAAQTGQPALSADHGQRGNNRWHEKDSRNHGQEHRDGDRADRRSSDESIQNSTREPAEVVDNASGIADSRAPGCSHGDDWSSCFRQASTARRRAEEQRNTPTINKQSDRQRAGFVQQDFKQINPTTYLENRGFTVKQEGRHLSAQVNGDEIYRLTEKPDGRWLWCDNYNQRGGDNIDLVREIEPGTRFTDALYKLNGAPSVEPRQRPAVPARVPPRMPLEGPIEQAQGRNYLKGRGISQDTITHAEKSGMVQYCDGGVLFVGRDQDRRAQNVTRRAIDEMVPVQKRDLKGSDKQYAQILPGDPAKVWIVEGGTDALALHDIAKRGNQQPPTVIVSGGANVRSFLDNPEIQNTLRRAERVTICGENEKNPKAKARADAGHQKQADRVQEITGQEPRQWTPPEQDKDLAALNARQQTPAEVNRLKYEGLRQQNREQQEQPERQQEQDYSQGMSR